MPYGGVSTYMDQLWDGLLTQVSQGQCKLSQAIRNVIQLYVVLNSGDDNKGKCLRDLHHSTLKMPDAVTVFFAWF